MKRVGDDIYLVLNRRRSKDFRTQGQMFCPSSYVLSSFIDRCLSSLVYERE